MTEQTMTPDEVLAVIAKHRDSHRSCALADGYSAQEYPRLRDAHDAVAALIAEHNEDQGVIAVWRGRCERAEAERDALIAERDAAMDICRALAKLRDGLDNSNSSAEEMASRLAHKAQALAARAEVGHG